MVATAAARSEIRDLFDGRVTHFEPGLPLVGGLAAGTGGRGSTRMLLNGQVVERGAVGVLLGGDVHARPLVVVTPASSPLALTPLQLMVPW